MPKLRKAGEMGMTDELRESARNNYAAQMEMLGYQTDGNPKETVDAEQMQGIFDEICNEYCKYPEIALCERKDVDDANKLLMDKYCATCPIGRL